ALADLTARLAAIEQRESENGIRVDEARKETAARFDAIETRLERMGTEVAQREAAAARDEPRTPALAPPSVAAPAPVASAPALPAVTGRTSEVSGSFTARLASPGTGTSGRLLAGTASIDTGIVERNSDMYGLLEVTKYPSIEVEVVGYDPAAVDSKTGASNGTVHAKVTVHGVTKPLDVPTTVTVDESRRVVITGEGALR